MNIMPRKEEQSVNILENKTKKIMANIGEKQKSKGLQNSQSISRDYLNLNTHYNKQEKDLARMESAWAKAALFFRTRVHFGHSHRNVRCLSLPKIWQLLEVRRKRFESGDTMELLHVINLCAEENLPIPTWAALAFSSQFAKFLKPDGPISLDEVFSSNNLPLSPMRAKSARNDWRTGLKRWEEVWLVADNHSSLDATLETVLGSNKGKTKARKLVLMIDKNQRELLGKTYIDLQTYFRRNKI